MKKFILLMAALMAVSTFAIAKSGNYASGDAYVYHDKDHRATYEFYSGLSYSYMNLNAEYGVTAEVDGNALTILGGLNINRYFAIEGRYTYTMGDLGYDISGGSSGDIDGDMSNLGLYLKPMHSIENVTLYGLLGVGVVTLSDNNFAYDDSETSFQWGLGASLTVADNTNIFIDYIRFYDDKDGFGNTGANIDFLIDAVNFGITYKF